MKLSPLSVAAYAAWAAGQAAGHATFQDLWVDGVDMINGVHGGQCVRQPLSNSPVTNVMSDDMRCNVGTKPVAHKCVVQAGANLTVEMHQQPGDRSCSTQAIGGSHHGPVTVYLSKVEDSSTADGSTGWFKIFEDGWTKVASGGSGDDDHWGTKDLNACCGLMDVPLPTRLAPGDYLLRAQALALHTAGTTGGAQFYMSCYQLTITAAPGNASAAMTTNPYATVKIPGAYKASDPGILINIHTALDSYVVPGPPVIAGGTTRVAGTACTGCEKTCKPGSGPSSSALAVAAAPTSAAAPNTAGTANTGSTGAGADTGAACAVQRFGQCGGNGYTGCTNCASGLSCKAVSPPYYSQCA